MKAIFSTESFWVTVVVSVICSIIANLLTHYLLMRHVGTQVDAKVSELTNFVRAQAQSAFQRK